MCKNVFTMVKRIIESKTLTKLLWCKCKCKFDGSKCNSNQKLNNYKCWYDCKNLSKCHVCKKDYIFYPSKYTSENHNYV